MASAGIRGSLNCRFATFRARPLLLGRYCIGLLAFVALLFGALLAAGAAQPPAGAGPVSQINGARARQGVQPLTRHDGLDRLAQRYLDEILATRNLLPPGYGSLEQRLLTEDVVAAIGEDGLRYRYTGIVVTNGSSVSHATQIGVGTRANWPALLEPALELAGIASATIPAGEPWFAPPPGGVGLDVELTGQTVVVIVTAGEFRATT